MTGLLSKTGLVWSIKIFVSAGLLILLFRQTDGARLWLQIQHASPWWLLAALAMYLLMIIVSAWRWGYLLAAQHVNIPLRTLVGSYLVATFFNNFLPSNIGGDVVRIRDTTEGAGSKTVATLIVLIDRALGLIGLLVVAAVAREPHRSRGERPCPDGRAACISLGRPAAGTRRRDHLDGGTLGGDQAAPPLAADSSGMGRRTSDAHGACTDPVA